ncbi:MAG: hypothetical protein COA70_10000 [Planctomycetota bacterium]|nr:MAG: hypothetical protein COA70_10000 [Planctomycetota bacterium]
MENNRTIFAQSRTVLVEKLRLEDGQEVVRKTYSFPTTKDRLRGSFRGTLLGRNKAHREYAGLKYLERANIPVVQALEWTCKRNRLGFVTECCLTTRVFSGNDLAHSLKHEEHPVAEQWANIGASVRKMHDAGIWHRGLSARNLMIGGGSTERASSAQAKVNIAWLDTTKSKTYPPGGMADEKRAFDLLRFWTPLMHHTTPEEKRNFADAYGEDIDLKKWWSHIANWKRASFRRELQREEARFEERGS